MDLLEYYFTELSNMDTSDPYQELANFSPVIAAHLAQQNQNSYYAMSAAYSRYNDEKFNYLFNLLGLPREHNYAPHFSLHHFLDFQRPTKLNETSSTLGYACTVSESHLQLKAERPDLSKDFIHGISIYFNSYSDGHSGFAEIVQFVKPPFTPDHYRNPVVLKNAYEAQQLDETIALCVGMDKKYLGYDIPMALRLLEKAVADRYLDYSVPPLKLTSNFRESSAEPGVIHSFSTHHFFTDLLAGTVAYPRSEVYVARERIADTELCQPVELETGDIIITVPIASRDSNNKEYFYFSLKDGIAKLLPSKTYTETEGKVRSNLFSIITTIQLLSKDV